MARPVEEVANELERLGCDAKEAQINEIAGSLSADETILDAISVSPEGRTPDGFDMYVALVTAQRVLSCGYTARKGFLSTDNVELRPYFWHDVSDVRWSTDHKGQKSIEVSGKAGALLLYVPSDSASEKRFDKFLGVLQESLIAERRRSAAEQERIAAEREVIAEKARALAAYEGAMARPVEEVTKELEQLGCDANQAQLNEIAGALSADETILDAFSVTPEGGTPDGFDTYLSLLTAEQVLTCGYKRKKGFLSPEEVVRWRYFWQDILDLQWSDRQGSRYIEVSGNAGEMLIYVPLDSALEMRFGKFFGMLQERLIAERGRPAAERGRAAAEREKAAAERERVLAERARVLAAQIDHSDPAFTVKCPACSASASVFNVHCACGGYLPVRPPDKEVEERVVSALDQYEAYQRAAAEAAAKAAEPGAGVKIAGVVGAGLLGMIGGIGKELGANYPMSASDRRLQRNIEEGMRRAR